MAPLSRSRFARLLRGQSAGEFVSFVADLWTARGWSTDVRGDAVIATRQASTADRHVLLVRHAAPVLDGVEWSTERTDVTHVVTSADGSDAADDLAESLGAVSVDRSDVYDMAVYALDATTREDLFQRHFDRSATVSEGSGIYGSAVAVARTPRGKVLALSVVLLLIVATWGAIPLDRGSTIDDGITGDDTSGAVTSTPEEFTVPSSWPTPEPTPVPTEEQQTVEYTGPVLNVTPGVGDHAWDLFGGDPARTAHRPDGVGPRADVGILTQFRTDWEFVASPAVVDGALYVTSVDGMLYALDAGSLRVQWDHYLDGATLSSPAVSNGSVYVGSMSAINPSHAREEAERVRAFDAADGRTEWNASTYAVSLSSPAVVDETVYIGGLDGSLYALDADSGSIRWNTSTNSRVDGSPAVSEGAVFVGNRDGQVYAFDAADGSVRWNTSTNGSVISSPAVVDGTVYVGSRDGGLYALDADNGSVVWRHDTESGIISSPAVAGETVYVGGLDGGLYALDADTGDPNWIYRTNRSVVSSPAVVNGTVYFGGTDGIVYALDAGRGDELWTYDTGSRIEVSPAVANGVLYIGTYDGHLYALAERSGE